MGEHALGPGGFCVCPKCGYKVEHDPGKPPKPERGDAYIVVGLVVGLIIGGGLGFRGGLLSIIFGSIAGAITGVIVGSLIKKRLGKRKKDAQEPF